MPIELSECLSRSRLLLGDDAMQALSRIRVLIVGVGGVGSWCAEALARGGVEHLTLVDSDRVVASNVNRQRMALPATIGELKVEALARMLREINPRLDVDARAIRYTPESSELVLADYDFVIDAIDSVDCKAHLIRSALSCPRVTLFSSMGAAMKTDIFRMRKSEFRKIEGDGLARALRNRFKRDGAWPCRKFTCVWSDEPGENRGLRAPADGRANGSSMHLTAAFGLALAGLVMADVAGKTDNGVE